MNGWKVFCLFPRKLLFRHSLHDQESVWRLEAAYSFTHLYFFLRSCTCFTQLYVFCAAVRALRRFMHFTQLYEFYAAVLDLCTLRNCARFTQLYAIGFLSSLRRLLQLYASKHLCIKLSKAVITLHSFYADFRQTLRRLYVSSEIFTQLYAYPENITRLYAHFTQSLYAAKQLPTPVLKVRLK